MKQQDATCRANGCAGKIIILSAPSGTGKSTIIRELMADESLCLGFSISATSRTPRGQERDGVDYYFITDDEFRRRVEAGEFVEWEEVYAGTCYGTLASEVERVTGNGRNLIMDIDVKGGINVKRMYGDRALSVFVEPPSLGELERRLRSRATDSDETIRRRLDKAGLELSYAPQYDLRVVNDNLADAVEDVRAAIRSFIA